jgi:hypothetical protein
MKSNSEAAVAQITEQIIASLRKAGASWDSLEAHRQAGRLLRELKRILRRGEFGPTAEGKCGCKKQWRARLMSLDRNWEGVEAAFAWGRSANIALGPGTYSVDGALALVRQWRHATSGATADKNAAGGRSASASKGKKQRNTAASSELEAVRGQLNDAMAELETARARIAVLEEELHERRKPAAPEAWTSSGRVRINARMREKVRRVAASRAPGLPDACQAMEDWLRRTADDLGWPLDELLRECGVDESRVDWTEAADDEQPIGPITPSDRPVAAIGVMS